MTAARWTPGFAERAVLSPSSPRWHGRRIGLLGGSFNPAHGGHVHISRLAQRRLGLDAIWWLVSPQNPLKARAGMAPLAARLARARAIAKGPAMVPTAAEQQLGTRYTVDTVAALQRRHPKARFIWLIGADNIAQLHRWKRWRTLAGLVPIAVLDRPGYAGVRWSAPALARLRPHVRPQRAARGLAGQAPPAIVLLAIPRNGTSATALRAAEPDWADRLDRTAPGTPGPRRQAWTTIKDA